MRICFISPYSPRTVNGIGTFIMSLAKYIKKQGHEPVLLAKYEYGEISIEDVFNSSNIIEIKHTNIKNLANIHLTLLTLAALFKARHKIDIVNLQQSHMLSAFSAIFLKVLGIPIVATIHVKVPSRGLRKLASIVYNNIIFCFSDTITYVSEETGKSFSYTGRIIRNGTDSEKFRVNNSLRKKVRDELNIENNFILLFLGRVAFNKGIYELIHAVQKIITNTNYDIRLLVVGPVPPEEEKKYLSYIKGLGLENYVLNQGAHKEVQNYYCSSDLFVLPSHLEGLPLSLLEAMSSGLPCIVSRVGGVPEIINHGENGLLIEPKDLNDLVQKITWCLDHRNELKILGENAAKTVRERFSMERVANEYIDVYGKLLK